MKFLLLACVVASAMLAQGVKFAAKEEIAEVNNVVLSLEQEARLKPQDEGTTGEVEKTIVAPHVIQSRVVATPTGAVETGSVTGEESSTSTSTTTASTPATTSVEQSVTGEAETTAFATTAVSTTAAPFAATTASPVIAATTSFGTSGYTAADAPIILELTFGVAAVDFDCSLVVKALAIVLNINVNGIDCENPFANRKRAAQTAVNVTFEPGYGFVPQTAADNLVQLYQSSDTSLLSALPYPLNGVVQISPRASTTAAAPLVAAVQNSPNSQLYSSLSGGAIAGIVIGSVVFVAIVIVVIVVLVIRSNRKAKEHKSAEFEMERGHLTKNVSPPSSPILVEKPTTAKTVEVSDVYLSVNQKPATRELQEDSSDATSSDSEAQAPKPTAAVIRGAAQGHGASNESIILARPPQPLAEEDSHDDNSDSTSDNSESESNSATESSSRGGSRSGHGHSRDH